MATTTTRASRFVIVVPSSTGREMLVWELNRAKDNFVPDQVIQFGTPEFFTYRAWQQNLSLELEKDKACGMVVSTGEPVSIGEQGFKRDGSSYREHHAEENLLLSFDQRRRDIDDFESTDANAEEIREINMTITCAFLGLEPCFGNRYPGHKCRDFFTPDGRTFQPKRGGGKVRARFIPHPGYNVVPIFCAQLQFYKKVSLNIPPGAPTMNEFAEIKKLDSRGRSGRDTTFSANWLRNLFGTPYGAPGMQPARGGPVQYPKGTDELNNFLVEQNWIVKSNYVVPKAAQDRRFYDIFRGCQTMFSSQEQGLYL